MKEISAKSKCNNFQTDSDSERDLDSIRNLWWLYQNDIIWNWFYIFLCFSCILQIWKDRNNNFCRGPACDGLEIDWRQLRVVIKERIFSVKEKYEELEKKRWKFIRRKQSRRSSKTSEGNPIWLLFAYINVYSSYILL